MPDVPESCLAFAEDLSALIDAELDAVREAEVRAHVDACAHCTRQVQELCNVDLTLAALAPPALADDLRARLATRLAADAPNVLPLRRPRVEATRRRVVFGVAAGLAAAAAVALAVLVGLPRDPATPGLPIAREAAPAPQPEAPRTSEAPAPDAAPSLPEARIAEAGGAPAPLAEPESVAEPHVVAVAPAAEPTPAPVATLAPEAAPVPTPAAELALLEAVPDEDLALALDLDSVEELDLVANLDLLEALIDLTAEGGV